MDAPNPTPEQSSQSSDLPSFQFLQKFLQTTPTSFSFTQTTGAALAPVSFTAPTPAPAPPQYDVLMNEYALRLRNTERLAYSRAHLDASFLGRRIDTLRRTDIQDYITGRLTAGTAAATINRELDDLSAAINSYSFVHELPLANPVSGMSLEIPEGRVRWITPAQAESLIAAARTVSDLPHLTCFAALAFHTGARKNELLKLPETSWRRSENTIALDGAQTKTKRRRLLPLNATARAALERMDAWRRVHCPWSPWIFPSPVTPSNPIWKMDKLFKRACARVNIEDFRIHDMRHTFASWLVMAGVNLLVVRDLLGHSSVKMTERYAHLASWTNWEAVQRLDPAPCHDVPAIRPDGNERLGSVWRELTDRLAVVDSSTNAAVAMATFIGELGTSQPASSQLGAPNLS